MIITMNRGLLVTLLLLTLISLLGCRGEKPHSPEETMPVTPEDITSVRISYNHMTRNSAYSYSLEEKDGETLFSCNYFIFDDDDLIEITIEKAPVDSGYMETMRELVARYGFLNMQYRESGLLDRQISDAPNYSLLLGSSIVIDGRTYTDHKRLNYFPDGTEEMKEIFLSLAEICADKATFDNLSNYN